MSLSMPSLARALWRSYSFIHSFIHKYHKRRYHMCNENYLTKLFYRSWCISSITSQTSSKSPTHPLQLVYKASVNTSEIPLDLKPAITTPIYKGVSRNLSENYRHIAHTSHLIKLLEIVLQLITANYSKHIKKEPQATWLPICQILPVPATGAIS